MFATDIKTIIENWLCTDYILVYSICASIKIKIMPIVIFKYKNCSKIVGTLSEISTMLYGNAVAKLSSQITEMIGFLANSRNSNFCGIREGNQNIFYRLKEAGSENVNLNIMSRVCICIIIVDTLSLKLVFCYQILVPCLCCNNHNFEMLFYWFGMSATSQQKQCSLTFLMSIVCHCVCKQ